MAREPSKLARGVNQRISKLTAKLDDHHFALGVVAAAIGLFLAWTAFQATTGPPFQSKYEVKVLVPPDAPVLRTGQAVRISGQLAGLIESVEPDRETGSSEVTMNITKTQFRPIGEGTRAYVRVHSIVYQTYLELRGVTNGPDAESGHTISAVPLDGRDDLWGEVEIDEATGEERLVDPVTDEPMVDSGVDLLEVVQLFDEETRESLRKSVVNVGFGLAGRGAQRPGGPPGLNEALEALAPPYPQELRSLIEAAIAEEGAIERLISGAARTTEGLRGERPDDAGELLSAGSDVFGTIGGKADELRATINLLRPFEDEFLTTAPILESALNDLAATGIELEPAIRGLNAALPDVNRLLGLGETLRTQSARITAATTPFLEASIPLAFELYPIVAALELGDLAANATFIADVMRPFGPDIAAAGTGLAESTSIRFNFGQGIGVGAPAGRVIPVLTPFGCRDPFPGPGGGRGKSCPGGGGG